MKDTLFDTPEKIDTAVASFKLLLDNPGWQLMEQILESNIEAAKGMILRGTEDETKESIDRLRDRLYAYEDIKNTPRDMIEKLTQDNDPEEESADPYETVEDLQKKQSKVS